MLFGGNFATCGSVHKFVRFITLLVDVEGSLVLLKIVAFAFQVVSPRMLPAFLNSARVVEACLVVLHSQASVDRFGVGQVDPG